jgi:intracellular sulfur oxidation DsrE/DsrF family protein
MVKFLWRVFAAWVAALGLVTLAWAAEPIKVVYHLTTGTAEAARAIGNIRNHLAADPTAKIVVVANGDGVQFMLEGAQTPNGQAFAGAVADLANKGVEFRVCNNTLTARNIDPNRLLPEARIVPSGVAESARLQAREGYVYLKP